MLLSSTYRCGCREYRKPQLLLNPSRAVVLVSDHTLLQISMSPRVVTSPVTIPEAICKYVEFIMSNILKSSSSPVYEYPLNGQWIMLDMDDGYVLWTGIWKGTCCYTVNAK